VRTPIVLLPKRKAKKESKEGSFFLGVVLKERGKKEERKKTFWIHFTGNLQGL
jgi:hypothetical protein